MVNIDIYSLIYKKAFFFVETGFDEGERFLFVGFFFMSLEYDILHITLKCKEKKIIILSTSGVHLNLHIKFIYFKRI